MGGRAAGFGAAGVTDDGFDNEKMVVVGLSGSLDCDPNPRF